MLPKSTSELPATKAKSKTKHKETHRSVLRVGRAKWPELEPTVEQEDVKWMLPRAPLLHSQTPVPCPSKQEIGPKCWVFTTWTRPYAQCTLATSFLTGSMATVPLHHAHHLMCWTAGTSSTGWPLQRIWNSECWWFHLGAAFASWSSWPCLLFAGLPLCLYFAMTTS